MLASSIKAAHAGDTHLVYIDEDSGFPDSIRVHDNGSHVMQEPCRWSIVRLRRSYDLLPNGC